MNQEYHFVTVPPHVGFIVITPGFKVGVYKKPNWFSLLMMRLTLGWRWEKAE